MHVRSVLAERGREVRTIPSDSRAEDALVLRGVGKPLPFMVVEGNVPVGILAESHLLDYCLRCGGDPGSGSKIPVPVKDMMSTRLIIAAPGDEIASLFSAMLQRGVEVLAVVEEGRILGMLFMTDLMRYQIESLTAEIENLREYLKSLLEAMTD